MRQRKGEDGKEGGKGKGEADEQSKGVKMRERGGYRGKR